MIRINNIKIRENLEESELIKYVLKKNKLSLDDIKTYHIFKKSIDARNKNDVCFVYTIDFELKNLKKGNRFQKVEYEKFPKINTKNAKEKTPVIIGAGPAGLFAAITFIDNGVKPILVEQGKKVEERIIDVNNFFNKGILNTSSNVQFGEGGAGTFSDGKLNTGNVNVFTRKVLEIFARFGAPKEILYTAKPHIGTDNLVVILKNIREYILSNGGKIYFEEKVVDFNIKDGKIYSVITSKNNEFLADYVILAVGHSAKDTFKKLFDKKVALEPKNFAVGVRIEHLQSMINKSQYGENCKLKLPAADYKTVEKLENGRTCYSFCMCPGGEVVASSSDENTVVTNGMSRFLRDGENANSALLVNVDVNDLGSKDALAGIYFQEDLEKKAFILGGQNYFAPAQRVEDFLNNKKSIKAGNVKPTYKPGVKFENLNTILPDFVAESLKLGIKKMGEKIKGFDDKDALLIGVETRTSSPVRIIRCKDTLMCENVYGLYPCGEGAGYAGGITTAAVDGIKCAIKILEI